MRLKGERPLTSRQLARQLKVTERTLATWRRDRKIPYWEKAGIKNESINSRNVRYVLTEVVLALAKKQLKE